MAPLMGEVILKGQHVAVTSASLKGQASCCIESGEVIVAARDVLRPWRPPRQLLVLGKGSLYDVASTDALAEGKTPAVAPASHSAPVQENAAF